MITSDVPLTYDQFETYDSFKWTNDLALTEKIWIFSASLTTRIIISSQKKAFKNNYILKYPFL